MLQARYNTVNTLYPYVRSTDQDADPPIRHPVVIVGGGPVGLATALDLGLRGTPVIVLDDHDGAGEGSRAICFSRRTLDIADRLGCGEQMLDKGEVWNVGRVFYGDDELFTFDLSPEGGQKNPAFINLQQPYVEQYLVERIRQATAGGAPIEIRGCNRLSALTDHTDHLSLTIETPEGAYPLEADWLIACDGARSPIRGYLGLDFEGRVFEDNFLIADVRMTAPFPTERWFWFDPPFGQAETEVGTAGIQSALLHKQPDDIWRIDFQLGWDIDRERELDPVRIRERIDLMLGDDVEYELHWTSIYTFQCRRMQRFRSGSVLFAGDSAHQVSPFGARGANSGIQDAENLAWKLNLVVRGLAPDALLDSYDLERLHGADENIQASTRTTDFLTPKSGASKLFRDAVLQLARQYSFARPLINSGRLSVPCTYDELPLNGADELIGGPDRTRVGAPCSDAPVGRGNLLSHLGDGFIVLTINTDGPVALPEDDIPLTHVSLTSADDPSGHLAARYLGTAPEAVYLIRPDQHVVARWPHYDAQAVQRALRIATARNLP